ncbi:tetratricopeptide repeat protein [Amaricoccus tamworthensis]|uniref:tetratricopeptide repeat protein n=1 Tax=Amaricoccus tamworthensis TaxID=57002 RepID=UPI003C7C5443
MANGLEKAVTACVGLGALALGMPLPPGVVETAVGVAGLTEFVAEKNQKFGPECKRVRAKTRKAVREGFAEFLRIEGDEWSAGEDLTAADAALAKHLGSCVMDRERLAEDFVSKGFPGVAVDRLMGELAGHEPELFGAEATGSVSHRYARRVLEVSLRAVVENREYYEALEPYIIWKMGLALGILVEHAETTLKLLNDMADAIERLERKANRPDPTRAQSLGFARTILDREIPDDQLEAALFEINKNFFTMRTEIDDLKGLSNEVPDILPHLEAAQAALEREDMVELAEAETELREVRRIYEAGIAARRAREDARREKEERRRREEDGTRARIAETLASAAAARLDRPGAAAHYGEAAALWPERSRERMLASLVQGDLLIVAGDTAEAVAAFQAALDVAKQRVEADPSSAANARNFSVSLDRIGDVRSAQGNLAGALEAYTQGMEIAERLARVDPSSAANARDLSVSLNKIGDVRSDQGNLAGALEAYTEAMEIRERLARDDPSNADWARDVVVSHAKLALADSENAVAHWREVVARLGAMREAGILRPVDERLIAVAEEELRKALEGRG